MNQHTAGNADQPWRGCCHNCIEWWSSSTTTPHIIHMTRHIIQLEIPFGTVAFCPQHIWRAYSSSSDVSSASFSAVLSDWSFVNLGFFNSKENMMSGTHRQMPTIQRTR
jgi:hypothetical protein